MTETVTYEAPPSDAGRSGGNGDKVRISLPACPKSIQIGWQPRHETAPRTMPIRGDTDWKKDKMLRQADKRRDRG